MDIKNISKVLYQNRTNPDYNSNEGKRRILASNGIKLAKATFEKYLNSISSEIDSLHDIEFATEAKKIEKKDLENIFTQTEYVNGLKKIWEGEKVANMQPQIKHMLQAGSQLAAFFGWNVNLENKDGSLPNSITRAGNTFNIYIDFSNTI